MQCVAYVYICVCVSDEAAHLVQQVLWDFPPIHLSCSTDLLYGLLLLALCDEPAG